MLVSGVKNLANLEISFSLSLSLPFNAKNLAITLFTFPSTTVAFLLNAIDLIAAEAYSPIPGSEIKFSISCGTELL